MFLLTLADAVIIEGEISADIIYTDHCLVARKSLLVANLDLLSIKVILLQLKKYFLFHDNFLKGGNNKILNLKLV